MKSLPRPPVILLLSLFFLFGCDVLLPSDWGKTPYPCRENDDCASGYYCEANAAADRICIPEDMPGCQGDSDCAEELDLASAYCASGTCEPWHETGFGDACSNAADCNSGLGIDQCVRFLEDDDNRYCTRACTEIGNCSNLDGDAQCMATGTINTPRACGRPAFTWGTGAECPGGNTDCDFDTVCVTFPFRDWQPVPEFVCAQPCEDDWDCPSILECGEVGSVKVCGHPDWFGFYHECTLDSDCERADTRYAICSDGRCSRSCERDTDCPFNAYCHQENYCALD